MTELNNDELYELRAEIVRSMAHPARLKMIDAMAREEMCVCDLAELVDLALPTVSRHLQKMKAAGLVAARRDGNYIYHHLQVPCVAEIFGCVDTVLHADEQRARDVCTVPDSSDSST